MGERQKALGILLLHPSLREYKNESGQSLLSICVINGNLECWDLFLTPRV